MASLFELKGDLPPGVNPHPTFKGKQRFEALVAFNWLLTGYILIHKLIVPLIILFGQTPGTTRTNMHPLGVWYLYHFIQGVWLTRRAPRRALRVVYLAWFALGFLPWMILGSMRHHHQWAISWLTISGLLTYGLSMVVTMFILYRMRMPTTAFLFKLPERIIPKWKYAVPYASIGFFIGWILFLKEIHV